MFQQFIPLADLIQDVNENQSKRLMHILQKIVDYSVNQKDDINSTIVILSVPKVNEGRQIELLEVVESGV